MGRWLRRAQPPRGALVQALIAGLVSSLATVGLFVGALGLLVVSATRPGLRAVAGVLIVIELLAFLRSPLRFSERLAAHRLGFAAVTRWRRWLVRTIGAWDYARWRTYAAGDLLERSLGDTDELQDLWLRGVLPISGALATMALGDLVIALLPPHGGWWMDASLLALTQALGAAVLALNVAPMVRTDRVLRAARGGYRAHLVELSTLAPDLSLLGGEELLERRSRHARSALRDAERAQRRQRRRSQGVAVLVTVVGLGLVVTRHPRSSPTWTVVVTLIILSTYESLGALRSAAETTVALSAASERLEDLEGPARTRRTRWPLDTPLVASELTLSEEGEVLLERVSFAVAPGQRVGLTGRSGVGKSTLLRALANLDSPDSGAVSLGATPIGDIDEVELRERLIYVPSEPGLTRGFANDVITLGRHHQRDSAADLETLGILIDAATKWDQLSRGERQRIAIVRAMVTSPSFYLLDEPTSGLGRDETDNVLSLLASTGAAVVVATHDPHVLAWCDHVLELSEGSLSAVTR